MFARGAFETLTTEEAVVASMTHYVAAEAVSALWPTLAALASIVVAVAGLRWRARVGVALPIAAALLSIGHCWIAVDVYRRAPRGPAAMTEVLRDAPEPFTLDELSRIEHTEKRIAVTRWVTRGLALVGGLTVVVGAIWRRRRRWLGLGALCLFEAGAVALYDAVALERAQRYAADLAMYRFGL